MSSSRMSSPATCRRPLGICALTHAPFEGPAEIGRWFIRRGHRLSVVPVYHGCDPALALDADLIVVMGGPMGVYDAGRWPWLVGEIRAIDRAIRAGKPVIGVCLGAQLIAAAAGARVFPHTMREIGWWPVELFPGSWPGVIGTDFARMTVFQWHGDTFTLPAGAQQIARSAACEQQGFVIDDRVVAVQFHLETDRPGVGSLHAAVSNEIGGGPYEDRRTTRGVPAMVADTPRYTGPNRVLLGRMLERLEAVAVKRVATG